MTNKTVMSDHCTSIKITNTLTSHFIYKTTTLWRQTKLIKTINLGIHGKKLYIRRNVVESRTMIFEKHGELFNCIEKSILCDIY